MAEMNTDAASLMSQAQQFEQISEELKASIRRVEVTASALLLAWHSRASLASQAALAHFRQAAGDQVTELNQISMDLWRSALQYNGTDGDQSSLLSVQMNF